MENKAKIAGILSIISGAFGVLSGIGLAFFGIFMANMTYRAGGSFSPYSSMPREFFTIFAAIYGVIGFLSLLIGVLAIVGGVFAIKKKKWGLALAGAIAGTVTFFPCGIPAIILVSMAKPEFSAQPPQALP